MRRQSGQRFEGYGNNDEAIEQARRSDDHSEMIEGFASKDTLIRQSEEESYCSVSKADETDFEMLNEVNKGLFSVKLKAGVVLAPHWNLRAKNNGRHAHIVVAIILLEEDCEE